MAAHPVLLVEDDPNDREIMSHTFKKVAPNVLLRTAFDGEDAIAYLSGQGLHQNRDRNPIPHLVLLDLKLPKKSGLEVLEWIRKHPSLKELPVIVLTSSQEQSDLDRAYSLGANSYVVKSVDLKVMREVLRGVGEYAALLG